MEQVKFVTQDNEMSPFNCHFNLPLAWSESIEIWQSCDGKHMMTPAHCDKSPLKEITLRTKEKRLFWQNTSWY
jgi:hypothetical protein